MFTTVLSAICTLAVVALSAEARSAPAARDLGYSFVSRSSPHKRTLTGQTIAFACYGGGGDCECPTDLYGKSGVLINVYPGYQCAYAGGACTWDDKVRFLVLFDV